MLGGITGICYSVSHTTHVASVGSLDNHRGADILHDTGSNLSGSHCRSRSGILWLGKGCGRLEENVRGIKEIGGAEVYIIEMQDFGMDEMSLREIYKAVKMWLF